MLVASAAILIGFFVLGWSADRLVINASHIARHFGLSNLLVGLTIVALGTSAPEIFVSTTASLTGNADIAIGNAVGSNIANIALVLGATAIILPIHVHASLIKKELPILLVITVGIGGLFANGYLGVVDGGILLFGLLAFMVWLIRSNTGKNQDPLRDNVPMESRAAFWKAMAWLIFALILLPLSSRLLVWGASEVARYFGLSELIIGLTIIAIGTSLPELATSVAGALKGKADLAVGNIVGSNVFNLLAVLPWPGILAPGAIDDALLWRDYPVLLALTIMMIVMCYSSHPKIEHKHVVSRVEGGILLSIFVGYITALYWISQNS